MFATRDHYLMAQYLFLSLLSDDNRRLFIEDSCIMVQGSAGGLYGIRYGFAENVHRMDPYRSYCAHPPVGVGLCEYDAMMAQMFKIVTDEPGFLKVAQ